jgi:hypothetical protein
MLMALRVHAVHEDAKRTPVSASLMPSWFSGDDWKLTSIMEPTTHEEEEDIGHFDDEGAQGASGHRRVASFSGIGASKEHEGMENRTIG